MSALIVASLMSAQTDIDGDGTVAAVDVAVYSDAACTQELTSVHLGTCYIGTPKTFTFYVKNNGTVPMTLSMTSTKPAFVALTWDANGKTLAAGASTAATATLTLSDTTATSFAFNMVVIGTEIAP